MSLHHRNDGLVTGTVARQQLDHRRLDERHIARHHKGPRRRDPAQSGSQAGQRAAALQSIAGLFVADLRQIDFRTRLANADDDLGKQLLHRLDHALQQRLFAEQQVRPCRVPCAANRRPPV